MFFVKKMDVHCLTRLDGSATIPKPACCLDVETISALNPLTFGSTNSMLEIESNNISLAYILPALTR